MTWYWKSTSNQLVNFYFLLQLLICLFPLLREKWDEIMNILENKEWMNLVSHSIPLFFSLNIKNNEWVSLVLAIFHIEIPCNI